MNAVRSMPDANLYASLVQMIDDVLTICGRRIFTPVASQLMGFPLSFLTQNRVKLSRGTMTVSGASQYDLFWEAHDRLY